MTKVGFQALREHLRHELPCGDIASAIRSVKSQLLILPGLMQMATS